MELLRQGGRCTCLVSQAWVSLCRTRTTLRTATEEMPLLYPSQSVVLGCDLLSNSKPPLVAKEWHGHPQPPLPSVLAMKSSAGEDMQVLGIRNHEEKISSVEPGPSSTREESGPRAGVGASQPVLGVHTCSGGTSGALQAVTSLGFTSAENKSGGSNARCSAHTRWVLDTCLGI